MTMDLNRLQCRYELVAMLSFFIPGKTPLQYEHTVHPTNGDLSRG